MMKLGEKGIKSVELHISNVGLDASETKEMGKSVSREWKKRKLMEKEVQYQTKMQLDKRTKTMVRLQKKAKAIDDLLCSSSNHAAFKVELE